MVAEYWLSAKDRQGTDFIDAFLGDPSLCRLYLGLSKLDPATADELAPKHQRCRKIRAYRPRPGFLRRHVPDSKRPGHRARRRALRESLGRTGWALAPIKAAHFFERLVAKDDGWLASYFDALARITNTTNAPVQDYLTEPDRLGASTRPFAAKSPAPARRARCSAPTPT